MVRDEVEGSERTANLPKVAIVTGAASGIGYATAVRLLAGGWRVAVADVDRDALNANFGDESVAVLPSDVSKTDDVTALFAATTERFGRLDAVANVAGVSMLADNLLEETSEDVFDRTLAINLRGAFLMCKYAIPALRASGGGAIVNLGSTASVRGVGGAAYAASKAGIAGLTRVISTQYAADGIRCNTVAPGPTTTPMLQVSKQKLPATYASGGQGLVPGEADPDEIAAVIEFLIADTGRFITGALYTVDGGMTQH